MYRPRQNLLRNEVIAFSVTLKCAKTSWTADVIIILTSEYQVSNALHYLYTNAASYTCTTAFLKIEENDDF